MLPDRHSPSLPDARPGGASAVAVGCGHMDARHPKLGTWGLVRARRAPRRSSPSGGAPTTAAVAMPLPAAVAECGALRTSRGETNTRRIAVARPRRRRHRRAAGQRSRRYKRPHCQPPTSLSIQVAGLFADAAVGVDAKASRPLSKPHSQLNKKALGEAPQEDGP